jgi:hypothetical protein
VACLLPDEGVVFVRGKGIFALAWVFSYELGQVLVFFGLLEVLVFDLSFGNNAF